MSTIYDLQRVLFNEKDAIEYLEANAVFYTQMECKKCGTVLNRCVGEEFFRCNARTCRTRFSFKSGTFFSGSKLKLHEILMLGHLWVNNVQRCSAITMSGHSSATITYFYAHFRQLVASTLSANDQVIGGPGIVVQIDETKMGKRKYHRGHRVEGVWVVAGVELTPNRRIFLVPVELRDAETLKEIVYKHVVTGSIIHTDMWKGYQFLHDSQDYTHGTVNHSRFFKDPLTNIYTNAIEKTNNGLKIKTPSRARTKYAVEEYLFEFIWRRNHEGDDLWKSFINALKEIHYDLQ